MPSPTSLDELLDLIQKSGVVDEKRLSAYVDRMRQSGTLPADPVQSANVMVRDGILTAFQSEQFLLGKWRRFNIGKYKVLEKLGSGGMGSVYLCEHKLMRRRVAVKVLPTAKAEDPASLERFQREAKAIAALDHPNIVRAYDIDEDQNLHFLVMEHVDGASFQEIIKKVGPMDAVRAAHYIRQAALGLQHAHEAAALVHRDIKPGNVLVDRNGIVKILDMGLARLTLDEEDMLTKKYDENVLGTADYLAPEQALDSHSVDIRADIYSLGATFYFTLTGRTPFAEGTVAQKLIWHQTRQPKAIRSFRPEVPEELVAVIEKMMAKDPNQRYQTPLAVAEALAPWTQSQIPPPPESEMPQLSLAAMGTVPGEQNFATGARNPLNGEQSPAPHKQWQVGSTSGSTSVPVFKAAVSPAPVPARTVAAAVPTVKPVMSQAKPPSAIPEVRPVVPAVPRPAAAVNGRAAAPPIVVPRKPAASPEATPKTKSTTETAPWGKVAPETQVSGARENTPPAAARTKKPPSRPEDEAASEPPKRHMLWWFICGGVLLAGVLGLLVRLISR